METKVNEAKQTGYNIYIAYVNSENKIVIDGEWGRNTYPLSIGFYTARALYRIGK